MNLPKLADATPLLASDKNADVKKNLDLLFMKQKFNYITVRAETKNGRVGGIIEAKIESLDGYGLKVLVDSTFRMQKM